LEECEEEDLPPDLDGRSAPTGVLGPDSSAAAAATSTTATAASRRQPPAPGGARRTFPPPAADACTPRRRPIAFLTFLHAASIAAKHKPNRLLPANRLADSDPWGSYTATPPTGYTAMMTADRSAGRERERRRVLEGSRTDKGGSGAVERFGCGCGLRCGSCFGLTRLSRGRGREEAYKE